MPLLQFLLLTFGPLLVVAVVAAGMWIPAYESARDIGRDRPSVPRQTLKVFVNMLVAGALFAFLPFLFAVSKFPSDAVGGAETGASWALGLLSVAVFAQGVATAFLGSALFLHVAGRARDMARAVGLAIIPLLLALVGFLCAFLWIAGARYADPAGPFGPEPWRALVFMGAAVLMLPASVIAARRVTEAQAPDWGAAMTPLWIALGIAAAAALLVVQPLFF